MVVGAKAEEKLKDRFEMRTDQQLGKWSRNLPSGSRLDLGIENAPGNGPNSY